MIIGGNGSCILIVGGMVVEHPLNIARNEIESVIRKEILRYLLQKAPELTMIRIWNSLNTEWDAWQRKKDLENFAYGHALY